jgi:hypothetical protein
MSGKLISKTPVSFSSEEREIPLLMAQAMTGNSK